MLSIRHPYIAVRMPAGVSYGGGQQFSSDAMVRRCGCGVIAATDLLLYVSRWHTPFMPDCFSELSAEEALPFSAYNICTLRMNRRYFPMIPYAGINGLMLMLGTQRFFREYSLPFTARWCVSREKLWERTEGMLRQDIPVILSAGQNLPFVWQNRRVSFYRKNADGSYYPSAGAKAHYFTVTGMDAEWLRISSWGRMYYLNRQEFEAYVRRYSASVVSNILLIERK